MFKLLNSDLSCKKFQFELGKVYEVNSNEVGFSYFDKINTVENNTL